MKHIPRIDVDCEFLVSTEKVKGEYSQDIYIF